MRLFLFLAALPLLGDPLILGHRGCRALRPENTLPAFEHALAVGADVLELDVVVTRDHALVVHHDLELNRKPVRKMTLDEVRAFDRGGTPSAGFPRQTLVPGAKVPLLEEVFAFAKERKARLMVETKVDPDVKPEWFAAAIDKLIRKYGLSERILLQSFDHRTLHAMRRLNPEVELVLLNPARRLEDYVGPAKELGPKAIQFVNFRVIDEEIVRTLHAAGIRVFSGTTDDRGAWGKLRALGVDGILTDDPEDLRAFLGKGERSRVVMTERRDGVVIEDLVFRNNFKEYDTAYRVCPAGATGAAAILFVHWLEPDDSTSNRSQFLGEALGLARRGACSLLVTAMWAGPDWFPHRDPGKDRVATERQRKRLGDALDFLLETPGIDRARVAYVGHDFGGMFGALMAADERRVGVWALQAATPRWHEWYLLGRKLEPAARDKVAAEMKDMDPVAAIGKGTGAFLFQFGTNDRFVPRARAEEFFAAAPKEKTILWYEAGHGLNGEAVRDRVAWLGERLRLR